MKKIEIVLAGCMTIVVFGGCNLNIAVLGEPGSGTSATEDRKVTDFSQVSVSGAGKINVVCGQPAALTITTDDNLLSLIESKVENDRLTIRTTKNIRPTETTTYDISTQKLNKMLLSGSGDIHVSNLEGEDIDFEVSGSGKIRAVGVTDEVSVTFSGSGKADLSELRAKVARIQISGSGSVTVNASQKLDVSIAGSGKIRYIGSPEIKKRISGSGSVRQIKTDPQVENNEPETADESEESPDEEDEPDAGS